MKKEEVIIISTILIVALLSLSVMASVTGFVVAKTKKVQLPCTGTDCKKEQESSTPKVTAESGRSPTKIYGEAKKSTPYQPPIPKNIKPIKTYQVSGKNEIAPAQVNTQKTPQPSTISSPTFKIDTKKQKEKEKKECLNKCEKVMHTCIDSCTTLDPFEMPFCMTKCNNSFRKCKNKC